MILKFSIFLTLFFVNNLYGQSVDTDSKKNSDRKHIKWGGKYKYRSNQHDTVYGFYDFYLRTVSYAPNGVELWTIDLPKRMRSYKAQSIYNKICDSTNTERKLSKNEIDINKFFNKEFLRCGVFISKSIIAISDKSGFLILNKLTGDVLVDFEYQHNKEFLYYDAGEYVIKTGNSICNKRKGGPVFISLCEENLYHFNGSELFVFNKKNKLIKTVKYNLKQHLKDTNEIYEVKAIFNEDKFSIEMNGMIFLR